MTNAISSPVESSPIIQAALEAGLITESHATPVHVTQASLAETITSGPRNSSAPVSVIQAPLAAGLTSGPQDGNPLVCVTQAPLAAGLTPGSSLNVTQATLAAGLTLGSSLNVTQATLAAGLTPGSPLNVTQANLAAGLTPGSPLNVSQAPLAAGLTPDSYMAIADETLNASKSITRGIVTDKVQPSSAEPNKDNNNNNKPSSAAPHKDNNNTMIPQSSIEDEEVENDQISDDESDTSVYCNIIPPRLQPVPNIISPMNCEEDNVIQILKPGIQVCAFEYNILPPVGIYYRVNKNHHLVKVVIEPGIIYQADDECNLYKVGLPHAKNSSD
jgi:hypothetical protein